MCPIGLMVQGMSYSSSSSSPYTYFTEQPIRVAIKKGAFLKSTKKVNDLMTKSFVSYVDLKKQAQIEIDLEDKDVEKGNQEQKITPSDEADLSPARSSLR
ncbi:hypothetical protein L2E82_50056 [Cichorium intybus]|nr:hypothetical protein L2E82_50056 [Cichorium intybus]